MAFIKITRQTFLSGEVANVGEIFEVDHETAKQTVAHNKGVIVEAPTEAVVELPKPPKAKKVSKAKEDAPADDAGKEDKSK